MKRRIRLPLLRDRHNHASLYAALRCAPSLAGLDVAGARATLTSLPLDRLSLVLGWRSDKIPVAVFEDGDLPPLLVVNWSLHGFAATPHALPFLKREWPELAERARDAAFCERVLPQLLSFYGRLGCLDAEKLAAFMDGLERAGFREAEDLSLTGVEALAVILDSPYRDRIDIFAALDVYRGFSREQRASCAGVKLFLDGALGARSAALDAPFCDAPAGQLLYADEELDAALAEIASYGARPAVHAIGHRAVGQILGSLERLLGNGVSFRAPRIEHAQFISECQARRARDLGAVLSMQPNFSPESHDYADRLIERHCRENNPFRVLVDDVGFRPGEDLVFGTDGMPSDVAFAMRSCLFPPRASQHLSIKEFEDGYGAASGDGNALYEIDDEARTVSRIDET